jgi:hypothetical protein
MSARLEGELKLLRFGNYGLSKTDTRPEHVSWVLLFADETLSVIIFILGCIHLSQYFSKSFLFLFNFFNHFT